MQKMELKFFVILLMLAMEPQFSMAEITQEDAQEICADTFTQIIKGGQRHDDSLVIYRENH